MLFIKDIIKLDSQGLSLQDIALRLESSKSSVKRYLDRARTLGIDWSTARPMTETEIRALFVKQREIDIGTYLPDWEAVYINSRGRNGRTIKDLWQNYLTTVPEDKDALTYSTFCRHFNAFKKKLPVSLEELSMTMLWDIGEVAMIDYAGTKMFVIDPNTGERKAVNIFVGILAYSNFTFCMATPRQTRDDWIDAIVEMLNYFGGVPRYIYLDNSTSLVTKASKFNPTISNEMKSLCEYYGCEAFAVSPGEPTHKALVEGAVKLVGKRILEPLSKRPFFNIESLNIEIKKLLAEHNAKLFYRDSELSRIKLYKEESRYLVALPRIQYEQSLIQKTLKVKKDYLIRYNNRRYSVPYSYVGKRVKVIVLPRKKLLEIYDIETSELIAQHELRVDGLKTTVKIEHMPSNHQYVALTNSELLELIAKTGKASRELAQRIASGVSERHAQKLLRGIYNEQRKMDSELFEQCCSSVLKMMSPSYDELMRTLDFHRDNTPSTEIKRLKHGTQLEIKKSLRNVRGRQYYEKKELGNEKQN